MHHLRVIGLSPKSAAIYIFHAQHAWSFERASAAELKPVSARRAGPRLLSIEAIERYSPDKATGRRFSASPDLNAPNFHTSGWRIDRRTGTQSLRAVGQTRQRGRPFLAPRAVVIRKTEISTAICALRLRQSTSPQDRECAAGCVRHL